jgi:hypothetical protein
MFSSYKGGSRLKNSFSFADYQYMNISSGLSSIGFNQISGPREIGNRLYLWPVYDAGRVQQLREISPRQHPIDYIKPLESEAKRLFEDVNTAPAGFYNAQGIPSGKLYSSYLPGSFFDARA